MNTVEDIKKLIPIFAVVIALAGFYYTTQHRLDHIEEKIEQLESSIAKNKKRNNKK